MAGATVHDLAHGPRGVAHWQSDVWFVAMPRQQQHRQQSPSYRLPLIALPLSAASCQARIPAARKHGPEGQTWANPGLRCAGP